MTLRRLTVDYFTVLLLLLLVGDHETTVEQLAPMLDVNHFWGGLQTQPVPLSLSLSHLSGSQHPNPLHIWTDILAGSRLLFVIQDQGEDYITRICVHCAPHDQFRVTEQRRCSTHGNEMNTNKIWGFHGGDYEQWRLPGCYAVWLL
jgi:hypothetical protein